MACPYVYVIRSESLSGWTASNQIKSNLTEQYIVQNHSLSIENKSLERAQLKSWFSQSKIALFATASWVKWHATLRGEESR